MATYRNVPAQEIGVRVRSSNSRTGIVSIWHVTTQGERGETKPPKAAATSVLSIRQPFAVILRRIKKIEYHSILTHKRERVYTYVSKVPLDNPGSWAEVSWKMASGSLASLFGTVEIVGCISQQGDYQWKLAMPQRLRKPIKSKRTPQLVFFTPF